MGGRAISQQLVYAPETQTKTKMFKKIRSATDKFLSETKKRAFSLIEILIVIAIVGIILSIAVPAMNNSRTESIQTAASANAKSLNDARTRAILKGDTNSVLSGNDAVAAAQYLIDQGYLRVNNP